MPYVQRIGGNVVALSANLQPGWAEEFLPDNHPDVVAFKAPPPRTIPLSVIQQRMEAQGLWDNFVNFMFGAPARRNAFLRLMMIGAPVRADSAALITAMQGAGFTQPQIDAVLA
jgi:hypothetical protein